MTSALLARVLAAKAPVVVLAGGPGSGRTTLLTRARARSTEPTVSLRFTRSEQQRPGFAAARLVQELSLLHPATPPDLRRLFATGPRVFLDDVQWLDAESLAVVLTALRGTPARLVCTCRLPAPAPLRTAFTRLRADRLAEVVTLRPLDRAGTAALLTELLQAEPAADLTAAFHRLTRGTPGALHAAVEGYRRAGSLRVVDRYAFLAPPDQPPTGDVPELRALGEPLWPIAKVLAVLHPLGEIAPRLAAEALGVDVAEVHEGIRALRAEGVLRPADLRFRLPLTAELLLSCLNPFERRRLAQLAVTAVWSGEAQPSDEHYLPERLIDAGGLVDPERSGRELLEAGRATLIEFGYLAERRLAVAAERLADPTEALFLAAAAGGVHRRFESALANTRAGLARPLPPDLQQELGIVHVVSLLGTGDTAALRALADGESALPGNAAVRLVNRAAALALLDRWREADELLANRREEWADSNPSTVAYALVFGIGAAALRGRLDDFERSLADPVLRSLLRTDERHRIEQILARVRMLLVFGELDRARALMLELPTDLVAPADRALYAAVSGRWDDALRFARFTTADGAADGYPPGNTVLAREIARILAARGQFGRARTVLDRARTAQPLLTHLLDLARAELEYGLGNGELAHELMTGALDRARQQGVVLGCDELWLRRAKIEFSRGDLAEARRCVEEIRRIADRTGTGRARLLHLRGLMVVEHDQAAADEALGLARERNEPHELATTCIAVVRQDLGDPKLLSEAYELLASLDALVPRAHVRNLMRERDVPVPGRAATVAENERLLAVLVAEGLTNRELATVLQTTEKSVEGRLTRLFARTGYRSRVELAAALLTGAHPG
ncbi:hypothetical protein [Amycolatopsis sacchari]|uniref:hypothetical protein n=1 Tax=Amycolatopsis sacchari TaxID=115433 RepID=UPI000B8044D7|nr:hypothetical protein [Amycolatopsis sacchari]